MDVASYVKRIEKNRIAINKLESIKPEPLPELMNTRLKRNNTTEHVIKQLGYQVEYMHVDTHYDDQNVYVCEHDKIVSNMPRSFYEENHKLFIDAGMVYQILSMEACERTKEDDTMFTMIIESDPEKLKRNGMDVDEFNKLLKIICWGTGFVEDSPNHYHLDENEDEIGAMVVLMAKFDKLGYIIPNLSTWITYCEEDGEIDHLAE